MEARRAPLPNGTKRRELAATAAINLCGVRRLTLLFKQRGCKHAAAPRCSAESACADVESHRSPSLLLGDLAAQVAEPTPHISRNETELSLNGVRCPDVI